MNLQHDDAVCHMFPYTFKNKALIWYFYFPVGSCWDEFGTTFKTKFGDEQTQ